MDSADNNPSPQESSLHNVLLGQINKYLGEQAALSPELQQLFAAVSDTYKHADEDRELNERSFELSSKELAEINHNIEREVQNRTRELRLEHARFIASANSLNAGLIICDDDGNTIVLNRAAKRILSYQVPGMPTAANLPLDSNAWTTQAMNNRFGGAFDLEEDVDTVMRTGTPVEHKAVQYADRVLRVFIAPVLGDMIAGTKELERLGSIIFMEDITEQKILERSRDEFFSIASHELRTPLTAIKGNTSMMLTHYANQLVDPSLKEMVGDIYESSGRLIEIVNDFLDVSRLEQGKMLFKLEAFDIMALVEKAIYEMQTLVKDRDVRLSIDQLTLAELPWVMADQNRTKQILYNLIGNSLKFTEHGEIRVSLIPEGDFMNIHVIDTGRGIPLGNQPLLFHKFQQAGTSILTRDATKGTGLGLYISKLLAERMGGHIRLEVSIENQGSTFLFTLPLATINTVAPAVPQTTPAISQPPTDTALAGDVAPGGDGSPS